MDLYTTGNDAGLFHLWGKLFALAQCLDTVRTGQVLTKTQAVQAVLDLAPEGESVLRGLSTWQASGGSWQTQISSAAQQLLFRYVQEKNLPRPTLRQALEILIEDLRAGGYYFQTSSRQIQVQADAGNVGDTALRVTDRNGLGWPCQLLPETIIAQVEGGQVRLTGQVRRGPTEADWPGGSEIASTVPLANPAQSLLHNADFETVGADGTPTGWLVHTGQWGQTLSLTEPEEQTLEITGSPTGGYFVLSWTDPAGRNWETGPLAYNAGATHIQSALRTIPGLEAVLVEGNNPYILTLEQTPGDIQPLTAINRLTGGSNPQVVITTTRQGDPRSYRGRSLKLTGNGTEQTLLWQTIRPSQAVVYGLLARACRTQNASGTLRLELRRGVEDGILEDQAGQSNRVEVSIASLPTSGHGVIGGFFRLRPTEALPVTFALHLSSPLPAGESLYLDEILLVPAQRLYAGGPYLAAASGWRPANGDRFTITISNDYAGKWEKLLDRFLDLRQQTDLALPTTGTILIPDSLVE